MTASDFCTATRVNGEMSRIITIYFMNSHDKPAIIRYMREEQKDSKLNMTKRRRGSLPIVFGKQKLGRIRKSISSTGNLRPGEMSMIIRRKMICMRQTKPRKISIMAEGTRRKKKKEQRS